MRGEHRASRCSSGTSPGSSPPARGAPATEVPHHLRKGIIPADAGTTPARRASRDRTRDHPRSRGEHATGRASVHVAEGSSPLARGALGAGDPGDPGRRIIPASAGSTNSRSFRMILGRDHPRVRGEHEYTLVRYGFGGGSSPRPRGARGEGRERGTGTGIIPASAGSTRGSSA